MSFLEVLVDGEIIREAMLVDYSDGEEIMYKGPNMEKKIKNAAIAVMETLPSLKYMVIALAKKKYVIISVSEEKCLVLGIDPTIDSEQLVTKMTKTLKELGLDW
ncbi:MAG: hypothetical protein ACO0C9_05005 [Candidatus Methanosuratincola verstraetei]|jgi:hypothetical protein|uniref:Roadblock/LAMTOR2 domain-containing protein n=2 Tax=Candidatus Methanosuratincola (ex Vanwonterghem et al. 2016) TaxID=1915412 RepID=A0A7J3V0J7_9CREN|nr:MAG: hypothetical protein Metus_1273 [Candidatus Methanosuratincola subterraneus]